MAAENTDVKAAEPPVETVSTDTTELGSDHGAEPKQEEWKPQKQELLVMLTLSIISLMVALDATIIVTSLSVKIFQGTQTSCQLTEKSSRPSLETSMDLPLKPFGLVPPTSSPTPSSSPSSPPFLTFSVEHTFSYPPSSSSRSEALCAAPLTSWDH